MGRDGFTGDCSRLRVDRQTAPERSLIFLGKRSSCLRSKAAFDLCRWSDTSLAPGACFAYGNASEQGGEVANDIDSAPDDYLKMLHSWSLKIVHL